MNKIYCNITVGNPDAAHRTVTFSLTDKEGYATLPPGAALPDPLRYNNTSDTPA